jgi:hypothetical protein
MNNAGLALSYDRTTDLSRVAGIAGKLRGKVHGNQEAYPWIDPAASCGCVGRKEPGGGREVDSALQRSGPGPYDRYERFDGRFGHLFYQESFSHYRLRLEYRFVGEQCPGGPEWAFRNSGIMVHGQTVAAMDKGQDFPVSIEVQLLGGRRIIKKPTANVCTPGTLIVLDGRPDTRHCIDSRSETYRGDQWVVVEVEVRGNELIRHIVGGETVLSYTKPRLDDGTPLGSGSISLQAESHPVEFRRVELLELVD